MLFKAGLLLLVTRTLARVSAFAGHFSGHQRISMVPIIHRHPRSRPNREREKLSLVSSRIPLRSCMSSASLESSTFLVRIVFLRALATVAAVAFTIALRQNRGLIGDNGICPARNLLDQAQERGRQTRKRRLAWRKQFGDEANQFWLAKWIDKHSKLVYWRERLWDRSDTRGRPLPTFLWMAKDRSKLNRWLDGVALSGLALSLLVLLAGAANVPILAGMYLCQRSLMSVGGQFYSYGWESQLAETLFHSMFIVPVLCMNPIPLLPVPRTVQWTIQWLLFRVMIGAGSIKLRSGDAKWKNGTAMQYFYETQPVPNPLTRYMHWLPKWWHACEVWTNHFVELVAPWFLIVPGIPVPLRRLAGLLQLWFQGVLTTTGNLAFINWVTAVPAIMCLDDAFLSVFFSETTTHRAVLATSMTTISQSRQIFSFGFLALILHLSRPVIRNLLSNKQVMNSSFDPLRLVNTYGAFGVVEEERFEYIISATSSLDDEWQEYEFKAKPGNVCRRPRWISPYHHRLDWQLWIAACYRNIESNPWILKLLVELLERNPDVRELILRDPFDDYSSPPKYIRVDLYKYRFCRKNRDDPAYWDREHVRRVYPRQGIASLASLKNQI